MRLINNKTNTRIFFTNTYTNNTIGMLEKNNHENMELCKFSKSASRCFALIFSFLYASYVSSSVGNSCRQTGQEFVCKQKLAVDLLLSLAKTKATQPYSTMARCIRDETRVCRAFCAFLPPFRPPSNKSGTMPLNKTKQTFTNHRPPPKKNF